MQKRVSVSARDTGPHAALNSRVTLHVANKGTELDSQHRAYKLSLYIKHLAATGVRIARNTI